MAEDREKLVQQQTQKMAEERNKIETFADFGNMYNFKKDFTYSYKTDAGLTPDIVREISRKRTNPSGCLTSVFALWNCSTKSISRLGS